MKEHEYEIPPKEIVASGSRDAKTVPINTTHLSPLSSTSVPLPQFTAKLQLILHLLTNILEYFRLYRNCDGNYLKIILGLFLTTIRSLEVSAVEMLCLCMFNAFNSYDPTRKDEFLNDAGWITIGFFTMAALIWPLISSSVSSHIVESLFVLIPISCNLKDKAKM